MENNYKQKYSELKLKLKSTVDLAFRLGVEEGLRQSQVQQANQAAATAAQPQPGEEGEAPQGAEGSENQFDGQSNGSELDGHISQLESMLGNASPGTPEHSQLQKSLNEIKTIQSKMKFDYDLKKSDRAIKAIGKSMQKFTLGKAATKNLSESGKKALSDQEKIVQDLVKSFAEEEKQAKDEVLKTLSFEQLVKG